MSGMPMHASRRLDSQVKTQRVRAAVDRVAWFLAPMLIGGREAPSALGGAGAPSLALAPRLTGAIAERVGDDILVTGRLRPLAGGG